MALGNEPFFNFWLKSSPKWRFRQVGKRGFAVHVRQVDIGPPFDKHCHSRWVPVRTRPVQRRHPAYARAVDVGSGAQEHARDAGVARGARPVQGRRLGEADVFRVGIRFVIKQLSNRVCVPRSCRVMKCICRLHLSFGRNTNLSECLAQLGRRTCVCVWGGDDRLGRRVQKKYGRLITATR